jgi:protoporphyrinogen oxidase
MQRGETLGHLAGGFFRLTDRLAERCAKQGVTFQFGVEVQKIEVRDGRVLALDTAQGKLPAGDAVVSTLASPALAGLLENHDDEWVRIARATPYMSCRCVTLLLSRSLSPFYWLSNLDAADFAAVIEQSKFFDDGTHLIYLPQYIFPTSIEQKESAKKNAVEWLSKVFPPFNADSVSEDIVSIDAFSQPVFLAGDDRQKWQTLRPLANLLATDAYLDYPHQRRTMNAAIRRAAAVVELLG